MRTWLRKNLEDVLWYIWLTIIVLVGGAGLTGMHAAWFTGWWEMLLP
jgi:hypothetical protein